MKKNIGLLVLLISLISCSDNELEKLEERVNQENIIVSNEYQRESNLSKINENGIWSALEYKFENSLPLVFSELDEDGWISHFVQDRTVSINDYTKDESKITTFYTGTFFGSISNFKLPAKLLAKIFFNQLKSSGYSHTEVDLLGVEILDSRNVNAHIFFKRFNKLNQIMSTSYGLYKLERVDGQWGISEMNLYPDTDATRDFFAKTKTFKGIE